MHAADPSTGTKAAGGGAAASAAKAAPEGGGLEDMFQTLCGNVTTAMLNLDTALQEVVLGAWLLLVLFNAVYFLTSASAIQG